jgi:hypothetical protein
LALVTIDLRGFVARARRTASRPFHAGQSIGPGIELPADTPGVSTTFDVPPAEHLAIEYVAGRITLPTGQAPRFASLITTVGDQRQLHQLPFHLKASADFGDIWHFGERVALYADAGTTVTVNVVRNQNPGNGFFHWTVSGYLTPAVRE